jgi:hypothetical protein
VSLCRDVGNMIGQAVCARYGQEWRRGNFRASELEISAFLKASGDRVHENYVVSA